MNERTGHRVDSGGVEIVYDSHGPDDGPPVILLHGFPDSARMWRHQVAALTAAGYRVLRAVSITSASRAGWVTIGRWPVSSSTTVAPGRRATISS